MPQHVRNFWLVAQVDGRATQIATGPARADGGMRLTMYVRHAGEVVKSVSIDCVALCDGQLCLRVFEPPSYGGKCVFEHLTNR